MNKKLFLLRHLKSLERERERERARERERERERPTKTKEKILSTYLETKNIALNWLQSWGLFKFNNAETK